MEPTAVCAMASPLERLPTEILENITQHIADTYEFQVFHCYPARDELIDFQRCFRALCLASKTLRAVATPHLYRHIWDSLHVEDGESELLLARTLIRTPELTKHVHFFSFRPTCMMVLSNKYEQYLPLLKSAWEPKDMIYPGMFRALAYGCAAAVSLVLLSLVKHVKKVDIVLGIFDPDRMLPTASSGRTDRSPKSESAKRCCHCPDVNLAIMLLLATAPRRGAYRRLESLRVSGETEDPVVLPLAAMLLGLPLLRRFSAGAFMSISKTTWPAWVFTSGVKAINLWDASVTSRDIKQMLGACNALEELNITWSHAFCQMSSAGIPSDGLGGIYNGCIHENIEETFQAIQTHKDSIWKLHLIDTSCELRSHGAGNVSFHDFPRLTDLKVDGCELTGGEPWEHVDVAAAFPAGLRRLELHNIPALEDATCILQSVQSHELDDLQYLGLSFDLEEDDADRLLALDVYCAAWESPKWAACGEVSVHTSSLCIALRFRAMDGGTAVRPMVEDVLHAIEVCGDVGTLMATMLQAKPVPWDADWVLARIEEVDDGWLPSEEIQGREPEAANTADDGNAAAAAGHVQVEGHTAETPPALREPGLEKTSDPDDTTATTAEP